MHFRCPQKTLLNSINIVQRSVSSRTTLPILKGILIEAMDNKIKLVATDLEIGIENIVKASVIKEGSFVLDARLLGEIIRKLPDAEVEFQLIDNNQAYIKCENSEFSILGYSTDDFPELTAVEEDIKCNIDYQLLKNMIKQTIFSASQDESRLILTGVLLEIDYDKVNMVALDGYRLAFRRGKIDSQINNKVVIPSKTLSEVYKIISTEEESSIEISLTNNNAQFKFGNTKIITRLLEGEFINYNQILPKEYRTRIKINTKKLLSSIERASLLAREGKNNLVKFIINDDNLIITSNSELGKVHDKVDIELEGEELEIAFNSKYFMDALKVLDEEEMYLEFTTNISPGIMRPFNNDNYTYLVLPVRLSNN